VAVSFARTRYREGIFGGAVGSISAFLVQRCVPLTADSELTLGFRAQGITIDDTGAFAGTVFEVRPAGEVKHVVADLGGRSVILRANGKSRPAIGSELRFAAGSGRIRHFNTAIGKRMR